MKIDVSSSILLAALNTCISVVRDNAIVPAVENFLFELNGETLKITGSDTLNTVETSIKVQSPDSGAFLVPARMLTDIIKVLPAQPLCIHIAQKSLCIKTANGDYTIPVIEDATFPRLDIDKATNSFSLEAELIAKAIHFTSLTMTRDVDMKGGGLYIHNHNNRLTFVTAVFFGFSSFSLLKDFDQQISFVLHPRSVGYLKGLLSNKYEVSISISNNGAFFRVDNTVFSCLLKDTKFFEYYRAIPDKFNYTYQVSRELITQSMKRVSVLSAQTGETTTLNFSDSLGIQYKDEFSSKKSFETVQLAEPNPEKLIIGVNGKLVSGFLSLFESETLLLNFTSPTNVFNIEEKEPNEAYKASIYSMPVNI